MSTLNSLDWGHFVQVIVDTVTEFVPEEELPRFTDRFAENFQEMLKTFNLGQGSLEN